jgi:alpha-ribazole phosphatase
MELYLIRHTRVAIEKSVCYGQSDIALADSFQTELLEIQQKLTLNADCAIYSSPLKRSLQLATTICPPVQPVTDERLMELNFGNWELKKWEEINKQELDKWMNDFVNVPCTGGESYNDLYKRCIAFFNHCIQQPHQQVLLVSHGGVIRSILSFVLQIPLSRSFSLQLDYGKISKLKIIDKENITVEYINN